MHVIAGLGNPKREYENTRHNVGFDVIDAIASKYGIRVIERKHKALVLSLIHISMKERVALHQRNQREGHKLKALLRMKKVKTCLLYTSHPCADHTG